MAVLGDVERVPVVGAEGHVGRGRLGQHGREGVQVLADRAFADQHAQALLQLLHRLRRAGRLVLGADAGGDVGVEVAARQQRGVPVDVAAREGRELGEAAGVAVDDAGVVHELRQPQHARVVGERCEVGGLQPRARRLHRGRGHAARQHHADVHHRAGAGVEEIADAVEAEHVGDLVRIADRRGDAAGGHAAVELEGRDQAALDVQVGVDEARHQHEAADVDHPRAFIGRAGADDGVAADRHVALDEGAGDQVEHAPAAQHEVGGGVAAPLRDAVGQRRHRLSAPPGRGRRQPGP